MKPVHIKLLNRILKQFGQGIALGSSYVLDGITERPACHGGWWAVGPRIVPLLNADSFPVHCRVPAAAGAGCVLSVSVAEAGRISFVCGCRLPRAGRRSGTLPRCRARPPQGRIPGWPPEHDSCCCWWLLRLSRVLSCCTSPSASAVLAGGACMVLAGWPRSLRSVLTERNRGVACIPIFFFLRKKHFNSFPHSNVVRSGDREPVTRSNFKKKKEKGVEVASDVRPGGGWPGRLGLLARWWWSWSRDSPVPSCTAPARSQGLSHTVLAWQEENGRSEGVGHTEPCAPS